MPLNASATGTRFAKLLLMRTGLQIKSVSTGGDARCVSLRVDAGHRRYRVTFPHTLEPLLDGRHVHRTGHCLWLL